MVRIRGDRTDINPAENEAVLESSRIYRGDTKNKYMYLQVKVFTIKQNENQPSGGLPEPPVV
jgi:hypothetical protein